MQLQINDYQVPSEISFNFEELKTEVANKMDYYRNLVYTDDQISEAKKDRATLRKFVDTLDSKRKEVKAEINAPYAAFEKKLKEITALINEPIQLIDKQVKEYEEVQKKNKENEIIEIWHNMDAPVKLDITKIWNPKWLNTTYSMNAIKEEMAAAIEQFQKDLSVIESMSSDYVFEGKEEYYNTLSLSDAISKMSFLNEQKKRKDAELQAQMDSEIARRREETKEPELVPMPGIEGLEKLKEEYAEPKTIVCFRAALTITQAKALNEFCKANGIILEKI